MDEEKDELYTYVKICADCGSKNVLVKDCREQPDGSFRRKKVCSDCGYGFWTIETEECMSDLNNLTKEIEALWKEVETLKKKDRDNLQERILTVKARVGGM